MNSFTSSSVNSARLFWCSITIGCTQERQRVKPKRRSTHVHKASIHTVTVSIKIFFTSPVINRPALYSVRIWEYIRQCVLCYATPSIVGHSVCNPAPYPLKLVIILQEEVEVLDGDIHLCVCVVTNLGFAQCAIKSAYMCTQTQTPVLPPVATLPQCWLPASCAAQWSLGHR